MASSTPDVVEMLKVAYNMELETVLNYLANSTNPDGVRAEEIKKSLAADITAELGHAQQLANRIKQLGGFVDGSGGLKFGGQDQPPKNTVDITSVIRAVIKAEESACGLNTRKSSQPSKATTTSPRICASSSWPTKRST